MNSIVIFVTVWSAHPTLPVPLNPWAQELREMDRGILRSSQEMIEMGEMMVKELESNIILFKKLNLDPALIRKCEAQREETKRLLEEAKKLHQRLLRTRREKPWREKP